MCRPLSIPNDTAWLALVSGALTELTKPWNWQLDGAVTVDEACAAMQAMIDNYYTAECVAPTNVPTPYWDEDVEVDDEDSVEVQQWYGYITDATLPPGELSFIEYALIWLFTGFIAAATWEVGFAPAVLFHTIAP